MGTIATILVIIGLLFGGTTATVYASQDALPNDLLYPLKLSTEDVQLAFTANTEDRINLSLNLIDNRIEEMLQSTEQGDQISDRVFQNLELHLNDCLQLMLQLQTQDQERIQLQIQERLQTQAQLLDGVTEEPLLLKTRTLLQERIQLIESGNGNLNGTYNEAQNGFDNTPVSGEVTPGQQYGQQDNTPFDNQNGTNGSTEETGQNGTINGDSGNSSTTESAQGNGKTFTPTPKPGGQGSGNGNH